MATTLLILGICIGLSFVYVFFVLREFRHVAKKRSEILQILGGNGAYTRSNASSVSLLYIVSSVLWSVLFFAYIAWLLPQL